MVPLPPKPQVATNSTNFSGNVLPVHTTVAATATASNVLYHIIGICIGAYAAYLSWQCNTAIGTSMPLKVLFAVLAYIFGFLYLICYYIFLSSTCGAARSVSPYAR